MFIVKELISKMDSLIIEFAKTTDEVESIKRYQRAVLWNAADREMCKHMFSTLNTDKEKFDFVINVYRQS